MKLAAFERRRQHAVHRASWPKSSVAPRSCYTIAQSDLHPVVQAKLRVGALDDRYEQEADHMAKAVSRISEPPLSFPRAPEVSPGQYAVQRKFAACGAPCPEYEKKKVQRHRREGTTDFGLAMESVPAGIQTQIETMRGHGAPLPPASRTFFEPRFAADFSKVRIHHDVRAARIADALHARAFTVGQDIVFGTGEYRPNDRRLTAHELTHVVQQAGGASLAVQREPKPEQDRLESIKEKVRRGEKLTEEEIDYVKRRLGKEIVDQLLGNVGQIGINYDSSRPPQDLSRRFRGRLELRLTGIVGAVASSLEGVAEADIDIVAKVADEKAVITIAPPEEDNRMAAMIREQLFPNGSPRVFDFKFPGKYFAYANAISLLSPITISLVGKKTKTSGAMIVISDESIPNGVELIITLAPSTRTTSVEETKRNLPGDHWTLTPNPRVFATAGYQGFAGKPSFVTTIGADFPLFYDTTNPLIYGGLGVRGSLDTNRLGRAGGNFFVGLNLDPLTLQGGIGAGAAFLPSAIQTPDGPAQTLVYFEVEGVAAYRVVSNLELILTLTAGGGKQGPGYGAAQLGAGYRF